MSRTGKSIKTESILGVARGCEGGGMENAQGIVSFWSDANI